MSCHLTAASGGADNAGQPLLPRGLAVREGANLEVSQPFAAQTTGSPPLNPALPRGVRFGKLTLCRVGIGFTCAEVPRSRGIPQPRRALLPPSSTLQEEIAHRIEHHNMDRSMAQTRAMDLAARCLGHDLVLAINHVEQFKIGIWIDHSRDGLLLETNKGTPRESTEPTGD